ncbi:MAG: ACT domain-containing protein, partial [Nakamurella sp.]
MSYVLRLLLPDRPGTLGAVATALGLVGADILAMDIVERSPQQAVDDIVVALPSGRQPDVLITAAETVPGVRVESVRPDPGIAARHREWELVEAIAADPGQAVATLARMLPQVLRAGWAIVVRVQTNGDGR